MMGNVAEWAADCQHPDYQGAPTDGSAWRDGCETEGDDFITRGGSFAASRQVLRSASRTMRAAPTPAAWAKASPLQKTSAPTRQAHAPMPDSWRRWKQRSGARVKGARERRAGEATR
ncbi:hypothetical protein CVO74_19215 [Xanthomonas prunicola]|uniref:Sulfatase-modifying factor enzyme-like domain-containing protein n=3 Tax=Xanthomonas prunicola TaxID=2053930 RepID=A0A2N3RGD5_9XANT|nr:hypothetical protein XpruCFBP8353_17225 [Xanthomonas prunicola]PKV15631.1 hypothetical protein XpruCFBP8354_18345 [Xanthomonas prunicola]PKV19649.1 hypothetical protein CVO74_19215 [Xanthomonas prunicola]